MFSKFVFFCQRQASGQRFLTAENHNNFFFARLCSAWKTMKYFKVKKTRFKIWDITLFFFADFARPKRVLSRVFNKCMCQFKCCPISTPPESVTLAWCRESLDIYRFSTVNIKSLLEWLVSTMHAWTFFWDVETNSFHNSMSISPQNDFGHLALRRRKCSSYVTQH